MLPILTLACAAPTSLDTAAPDAPVSILPLGDSLTSGYRVPGGYRLPLHTGLSEAGWSFDFVGSLASGPDTMPDRDHEGRNTFLIDELLPYAEAVITDHDPDVVLLLIGTNDVVSQAALESAPDRLENLLGLLSGRRTLIGTLPPVGNAPAAADIEAYNEALVERVALLAADGEPFSVVDHHAEMTDEMLVDAVHPDEEGYGIMAQLWLEGLTAIR